MSQHHVYQFDDFVVDPEAWGLYRDGREVHLEPVVLKLLIYLISHRDRLVTRRELMDTVWGETVVSDSALSTAIARLRDALDEEPSSPRYVETVHGKGYRFVAAVEEAGSGEAGADAGEPARRRRGHYVAIAVGLLLVLAYLIWPAAPSRDIRSLAVLPLDNLTGDPEQDQFVESLHEYLITELSQIGELRVTSRQSTMRYKGSELPLPDIARQLGVDALVEGSAIRLSEQVEIALQLIHGPTDAHLWAQTYQRDAHNLPGLFADVAATISTEIGAEAPSLRAAEPVDPDANRAYLLGLHYMNRSTPEGLRLAIENFYQAVAIEPGLALAWANLGAAHAWETLNGLTPPEIGLARAKAACENALQADQSFYLGHACVGWIHWFAREIRDACRAFSEALRLNPSDPYALHGNADCMMLSGRMDESVELARKAQMVDPFNLLHNRYLYYHLFMARRYDEAIVASFELQERFPDFSMHWFRALVYWQQGMPAKAIDEERLEFVQRRDAELQAALEEGLSAGGPAGALRSVAEARAARSETEYVDPFRIAETFTRAGLLDEAFHWFERAIERGSPEAIYIGVRPDFEPLHDDPRYPALLQRSGLPGPD